MATCLFFLLPVLLVGGPRYGPGRVAPRADLGARGRRPLPSAAARRAAVAQQRGRAEPAGRRAGVGAARGDRPRHRRDRPAGADHAVQRGRRADARAHRRRDGGQPLTALHLPGELADRAALLGVPADGHVLVADVPETGSSTRAWTYRRPDGTTLPVRVTVTRLLDDAGRHTGWIRIATDVTAEEAAQRQLVAAGERWRLLVDLLPDTTILVVGADLTCRVALGAATHRPGPALLGRTPAETVSSDNAAVLARLYRDALRGRPGTVEAGVGAHRRDARRPGRPAPPAGRLPRGAGRRARRHRRPGPGGHAAPGAGAQRPAVPRRTPRHAAPRRRRGGDRGQPGGLHAAADWPRRTCSACTCPPSRSPSATPRRTWRSCWRAAARPGWRSRASCARRTERRSTCRSPR